jgi:flagellar hook-length control protein FliK
VPVAAAQKTAAASQTAPTTDEDEGADAAPTTAINGRLAASGSQPQSQGNTQVEQNKAPTADPVTVKTDDAEQPAPQQSNTAQTQAKPQDSAAARPQESNSPVPASADAAAPKTQPSPAQGTPTPEPVRAVNASFEPAMLNPSGKNEWKPLPLNASTIAVEIVSRLREGTRRFDIRLDPPELGRVDVRLEVDRNGNVSTKLTVERPETLDLMQRDARALERALQQAGLKTDAGGLEFSLRQHADERFAQGQGNPGHGDMQSERVIAETGEPAEAVVQGYYRASALARGGVDITV